MLDARPDLLNHNLETVPDLYRTVRPQARYDQSLELLERAKARGAKTKTGIMVGLGETDEAVHALMRDVAAVNCDILTVGQYLQPTQKHLPVRKHYHPDEFARFKQAGEAYGIPHVESGPLVRSSYHAADQADSVGGGRAGNGSGPGGQPATGNGAAGRRTASPRPLSTANPRARPRTQTTAERPPQPATDCCRSSRSEPRSEPRPDRVFRSGSERLFGQQGLKRKKPVDFMPRLCILRGLR